MWSLLREAVRRASREVSWWPCDSKQSRIKGQCSCVPAGVVSPGSSSSPAARDHGAGVGVGQ